MVTILPSAGCMTTPGNNPRDELCGDAAPIAWPFVEVSDTTFAYDSGDKLRAYEQGGLRNTGL
jgi:hypothetical protein